MDSKNIIAYNQWLILLLKQVRDREIEKIEDFDGFDPSAKGQIEGINIYFDALYNEFKLRESD